MKKSWVAKGTASERQIEFPFAWRLFAKIDEVEFTLLACGTIVLPFVDRFPCAQWPFFQDLTEESDSRWALAMELATSCPPDDTFWVSIGFTMSNVGTSDRSLPKAMDHFFGGAIADQYEIRTAPETHVVRGLAKRITEAQIAELRNCPALQGQNWKSVEVAQWVELDAGFHLLLASQFGNKGICRVMLDLRDQMHRVITRVFHLQPMRLEESVDRDETGRPQLGLTLPNDSALLTAETLAKLLVKSTN